MLAGIDMRSNIARDPADLLVIEALADENYQLRPALSDVSADYVLLKSAFAKAFKELVSLRIRERRRQITARSSEPQRKAA